jgi:hypothetical protein
MAERPLKLDSTSTTRIWMVILGGAFVLASFATPWWTRGMNVESDNDGNQGGGLPGTEGLYFHYGPFSTPGGGGVSTDASRETVTGVLGILMVSSTAFVSASFVIRHLHRRGTIEASPSLPVGLAIAGFGLGFAAVLTGLLFVPLMGSNPGFAYGDEDSQGVDGASGGLIESTRYANAGFFFGIIAFIAYPTYAWVDAAASRQRKEQADAAHAGTGSSTGAASKVRRHTNTDGTAV